MAMPTNEELAALFVDHFDLAMNTTPGTYLADMSDKEVDDHVDASRETAIAAVRDAILDALIAECVEGTGLYTLMGGWYCEGCDTQTPGEDWLRDLKESTP
ncbi:MAG TPA: hypothetical protein VNJ04_19635 [Gemmatimonadaceae bacterium]|nr:hypothetical protein [Gemmatimonadaceae bacterium]